MSLFENAYNEVAALVRKFDEHRDQFLASKYQEAHVRTEFIDPFWTALGWDVRHEFQTNPREQEVKIEKSDDVSFRKADYAFYLKPEYQRPVFLVEAKKPSHDLSKPEYYFQTARYGFNTSTSVAVLTDFKEFHIIDCRRKPELVSGIVEATRLFKFTYQQYLDRDIFGEIYWKFSREAVAAGKLKEYWKSLKKPKGAAKQLKLVGDQLQPPDDLFLEDLDKYRKELASAFKSANKELTSQDLTEAAQKVLDRLVFIRFLQDKGIISDFIIEKFTSDAKASSWKSFIVQSQKLDKDYNGVVFKEHFIDRPSFIPPKDDRFSLIADEFSHKRSPYLFSYIPVEILGSIYERFLGKVVVPKGSGIAVEEKPEVRKAGGVYYTPKYIVDYIVTNTVSKILDDKSPTEVANLRFADIACGSGSFLIAIFDVVNTHLERWYSDHPIEAVNDGCRELDPDEQGRTQYGLSLEQKRAILQNNIFGVDIDKQAVEVAQFSLFLKLLESETIASVQLFSSPTLTSKKVSKGQITFHHGVNRKILPDLSKNIQCGNSLVEYDISDLFPLTDEEEKRIKPFSFQSAFREIMANGGFDAIVGNPPYGAELSDAVYSYAKKYFDIGNTDTAALFMIRASRLLKGGGLIGYIIPKSFTYASNWDKTRNLVISDLIGIVDCSKVWKDVKLEMSIYLSCKNANSNAFDSSIRNGESMIPIGSIGKELCDTFGFILNGIAAEEIGVGSKMRAMDKNLNDFVTNRRGGMLQSSIQEMGDYFALGGKEIGRYEFRPLENKKIPSGTIDITAGFVEPDSILVQNIVAHVMNPFPHIVIISTPSKHLGDNTRFVILDTVNQLRNVSNYSSNFLNAILNSNLISWYVYKFIFANAIRTMHFDSPITSRIPFPEINLGVSAVRKNHDQISALVDQILSTKKQLATTQRDSEKEQLQRKCDYIDGEIDRLVYELYGLTAEEIKIVEG